MVVCYHWQAGVSQPIVMSTGWFFYIIYVTGNFLAPRIKLNCCTTYRPFNTLYMRNCKAGSFKGQRLFYRLSFCSVSLHRLATVEQDSVITTIKSKMPVRQGLVSKTPEERESVNKCITCSINKHTSFSTLCSRLNILGQLGGFCSPKMHCIHLLVGSVSIISMMLSSPPFICMVHLVSFLALQSLYHDHSTYYWKCFYSCNGCNV